MITMFSMLWSTLTRVLTVVDKTVKIIENEVDIVSVEQVNRMNTTQALGNTNTKVLTEATEGTL